jgi:indole-3-glycerol phosphate synthase
MIVLYSEDVEDDMDAIAEYKKASSHDGKLREKRAVLY